MDKERQREISQREAAERRLAIAPQLARYDELERETVLWPFVTATSKPGFTSSVVTIDGRGHRVTAVDGRTASSDTPPDEACFLLGGSYAFGVGAATGDGTLAAELWRGTGVPWVNLGVRDASSIQELVTALPFVERTTTFVVCSGLHNLALATTAPGLDPLFGPMFNDRRLHKLGAIPITTLVQRATGSLRSLDNRELWVDMLGRFARRKPVAVAPPAPAPANLDEAIAAAARFQLRDLRALRRAVPDTARVVFALQPSALRTTKDLSAEEEELFGTLGVLQGRRCERHKELFETHWDGFAATIEAGCAELGVPFVDLSRAEYTGWCYVDPAHMTDRGYEAAGAFLRPVLS